MDTFHVKMSSASMCYCLRSQKLMNLSLDSGCFLRTWQCAVLQSLLKNDGLPLVFKNFRPVSYLTFISKQVDTVVARQLQHYLNCNNLFTVPRSDQPIDRTTALSSVQV